MKKLVSILLVVAMLITSVPFALTASAEETLVGKASGISVELTSDSSDYNWGDEICFDVAVTNHYGAEARDLELILFSDGSFFDFSVGDEDPGIGVEDLSVHYITIDSLLPGETKNLQVVYKAEKADALDKLIEFILWPVFLFCRMMISIGYSADVLDAFCNIKVGSSEVDFVCILQTREFPLYPMYDDPEVIIDYFNKSINEVKTGAKSVEQKESVNYLAGSTKIGDGLSGIFYRMLGGDEWLDDMLQANSTGEALYTGDDIKKYYPVENESWASKLETDDIISATCAQRDGIFTIKVVTKADGKTDSVKYGEGHNPKVFNVVSPETINDNIPGIAKGITGDTTMDYPSGSVTITVDAATGHVLTAVYDAHWTINFDKMETTLPFATKTIYTFNG